MLTPLFRAMLVSNSALWVGPATVAMAIWYANREARFGPFEPYLAERTAAGASPLFLSLAVVAACAAWEGGRLRRADWVAMPSARPPIVAAAPLLGPPVAAALAVLMACLLWKLHMGGAGVIPDLRFLPVLAAIAVAWTVVGYALGLLLPPYIAAPAMLAGVYCWMALPGTLANPVWIRYLTGDELGECCALQSDIDPRALIAPLVFAAGLIVTAVLLLHAQALAHRSFMVLAIVPLLLGFLGGGAVARGLSPDPSVPRAATSLVCAEGPPRVCVWPEHAHLLPEVSKEAAAAAAAWSAFGVTTPVAFSEIDPRLATPGTRSFGPWSGLARDESPLVAMLATSMLPDTPACAFGETNAASDGQIQSPEESFTAESYPGHAAYDYVLAWFEATAGADSAYLAQRFGGYDGWQGPEILSAVESIRSLPIAQQQAWLQHNLTALATCDVLPTFAP